MFSEPERRRTLPYEIHEVSLHFGLQAHSEADYRWCPGGWNLPKRRATSSQTPPRISTHVELEATMSTIHPPETQFNSVLKLTSLGRAAVSGYVYNTL
jgi:hypothetical protein